MSPQCTRSAPPPPAACRLARPELHLLSFQAHPDTRQSLLESLVANLDDVTIGVRKTAVTLLAELWWRLGHG